MSGFVYIWRDKKHNRYYIGSHWGSEDDGYICSSQWMNRSIKRRPSDFRRRILSRISTTRLDLLKEEQKWLEKIKPEEIKIRYYNLMLRAPNHWYHNEQSRLTVGEKISKSKKGTNTGKRDASIGKKISDTKKRKCAERKELTGHAFSEEHRKSMSLAQIGKEQSKKSNDKRSSTLKSKYESGELKKIGAPLKEETKDRISQALVGIKRSSETKSKMSSAQSKTYVVKFTDGNEVIITGLKCFCEDNGIPYVTARKAYETSSAIKKYNIVSISILDK